ncbi:MFS transporter [Pseudonocardia sp. CA-107938]|uniref:MFS transporter n=1 Tax=Pseudonocardia sp. CA-107938 TaxID=3240021 RepID=UPI003D8E7F55
MISPAVAPERLVTGPFVLRMVTVAASSIGFFLPFAALPAIVEGIGGTGLAGATTAALLVATVVAELGAPRLLARCGYRTGLAVGLAGMGLPTLLLLGPPDAALVLAVSAVRGAAFGITVVAGGALTAALLPASRRGEGLAIVGLVSGVPALLALPAGTLVTQLWGAGAMLLLTALVPAAAIVTVPLLPENAALRGPGGGIVAGLRSAALMRPATGFAASAAGAGVVATFVPIALPQAGTAAWAVPAALLAQSAAATGAKLVAGRLGDRRGHATLLVPALLVAAAGTAALAATGSAPLVVAGAAVFGAGFGVLQNASLTVMYAGADPSAYGAVAAIWNAAYDGGMAAGAFAVGLLVPLTGFPPAFLVTAALMALALLAIRPTVRPSHTLESS